jgi:hypothetical protein
MTARHLFVQAEDGSLIAARTLRNDDKRVDIPITRPCRVGKVTLDGKPVDLIMSYRDMIPGDTLTITITYEAGK